MKILRLNDVKEMTKMSRSTIYALCANNRFPKQINLTERSIGWIEDEIQEWLQVRAMARATT